MYETGGKVLVECICFSPSQVTGDIFTRVCISFEVGFKDILHRDILYSRYSPPSHCPQPILADL